MFFLNNEKNNDKDASNTKTPDKFTADEKLEESSFKAADILQGFSKN